MTLRDKLLLSLVCSVVFAISFLSVVWFRVQHVKSLQNAPMPTASPEQSGPALHPAFSPQPRSYPNEPPAAALVGTVVSVVGDAEKQPRDQDEAVMAIPQLLVKESERITTKEGTTVVLHFPPAVNITVGPQTIVAFLSTDPAHFLVRQDQGTATYSTDELTKSISVRFLRGLFSMREGSVKVTTDPEKDVAVFAVASGSAKFGYINKDNQTQIVDIPAQKTLTFDNTKRSVQLN
jgi:hypothetical protein